VKVSLTGPASAPAPAGERPPPALQPEGPRIVLGGHDPFAGAIAPDPATLFGPRGAALLDENGPLFVADTGHHRVVGWSSIPDRDRAEGDLLLGQPTWTSEGRNAGAGAGAPSACSFDVPTGVATLSGGGLAVADAWNNRVLVWTRVPTHDGQPADLVLGQSSFAAGQPNHGDSRASAASMHWPFQTILAGGMLYVADAGNRRVLGWRSVPTDSGQPADFVLGQSSPNDRSDNHGAEADACSFRWPHDLTVWNGRLCLADAGNNRVLVWDGLPDEDGAPARWVLGQPDFRSVDHNRGRYWPDATCMNMPYALHASPRGLLVADTASSRLLLFRDLDEAAHGLTGQDHFGMKGDNRYRMPVRDSLCWPYGLSGFGSTVLVADTGNHRVGLWSTEISDAG